MTSKSRGSPRAMRGHLVLLGLKEQEYPGTKRIEDWPTWTMPILKWAQAAGRRHRLRPLGVGPRDCGPRFPVRRGPEVRRHRRQRVHRHGHGPGDRRLHLLGRHALALGIEHLVSRAERRIQDAVERRDRFPVYLRRPRRPRANLREAGAARRSTIGCRRFATAAATCRTVGAT